MNQSKIRELAIGGLIGAVYVVLSLAFHPISFGVYQVRVAEALTVLPFVLPAAIPGLYVGCLLANVFGQMGWLDIVVGPLITLVAAVLTRRIYFLRNHYVLNGAAIGAAILMWIGGVYLLTDLVIDVWTLLGILVSLIALVPVPLQVRRRPGLQARLNISVFASLILMAAAVFPLRTTDDVYFIICGGLLLLGSAGIVSVMVRIRISDGEPNLLLAPLPPVLLNAFGVSVYLAPIIGVNYWFSVQMIGVGQLIACYLIGLPLLLVLRRRGIFSMDPAR